jgi:hypothetical protein
LLEFISLRNPRALPAAAERSASLRVLCDQLEHTQANLARLQAEIEQLIAHDPGVTGLQQIPGFGTKTVAVNIEIPWAVSGQFCGRKSADLLPSICPSNGLTSRENHTHLRNSVACFAHRIIEISLMQFQNLHTGEAMRKGILTVLP